MTWPEDPKGYITLATGEVVTVEPDDWRTNTGEFGGTNDAG